jgi:hypothetical protein
MQRLVRFGMIPYVQVFFVVDVGIKEYELYLLFSNTKIILLPNNLAKNCRYSCVYML